MRNRFTWYSGRSNGVKKMSKDGRKTMEEAFRKLASLVPGSVKARLMVLVKLIDEGLKR